MFILPTRAECAGIVFCEAATYGLPSLSYRTGGVPDYIVDGETGFLFDIEASPSDYAEKVVYLANHPEDVERMKIQSRQLYESDLNWKALGLKLEQEFDNLIASGRVGP